MQPFFLSIGSPRPAVGSLWRWAKLLMVMSLLAESLCGNSVAGKVSQITSPATTVQTTLFSDTFSGDLSQWNNTGTASIASGQLQVPTSLEMIRANAGAATWTDYTFTSNVTITATAVGVVFRSPDVNSGYMWQLNTGTGGPGGGKVVFHRKVSGTWTALKTIAYPAVRRNTALSVQIVTSGSTFSLSIGGTLVDTETDSAYSQGVVGFRTGSTETGTADNVVVYTQTDVTLPGTPTGFAAGSQWNNGSPFAALTWAASTTGTPTGFVLERRVSGTTAYSRLTGLSASAASFNDDWIQPNTSYDYRLSAFNAYGSSGDATTTFPAATILPSGYVGWAQAIWPATGNSLATGSLWTDTATYGFANSLAYAFSGNPVLSSAPGGLSVVPVSSNSIQVWGNSFPARADTHYQLQGSADLSSWATYLDETSTQFSQISGGAGTSAPLLSLNPASASVPRFFRWSISPNTSASVMPTGMLVNGLAAASGATLTQSSPVFSWVNGNDTQTAYEILVATSPTLLTEATADVWNSGKTTGNGSINVPFAGLALKSNTTYYWTVRTWNSSGAASPFSTPQTFTTGTLTTTYQTDRPKVIQETIAPVAFVQKGTGWYFADFGKDAFGTVTLNIPSPVAGQVVTVGMGEQLSSTNTVNTAPSGYVRYQSQSITLQSGVTSYTVTPTWTALYSGSVSPPSYIGQVAPFRYVEIKNVPGTFTASQLTQLAAHTPFDDTAATFTSSDALLNNIWALCKYTTKATTFTGYIVDGDRERIPYEADSYIAMLNQYCLNRDYATARCTHEYLLTHSTWPTEWVMQSILMAYNDYLYTGDTRSLAANYTALQAKLLPSHVRSDGLYMGTTGTGSGSQPTDIVDWPATERNSYDMAMPVKTVTSSFRYQALVDMQQIATALGKTADASTYQTAAALTLSSINSNFLSSTKDYYLDGMTSAGVVDSSYSLHANFFPLALGIVPAASQADVVAYIKSILQAANDDMVCSPYGAQFLLEALYGAGEGKFALSLFDSTATRSWYNMLTYGTTMTQEAWDMTLKTNEDWNHVWGSAAANIIPRWLMGVRPLLPGFQKILIQPQPGSLTYASLTMPTVRGSVSVNIQANTSTEFTMTVTIPANTTAKVGLPTLGSTSTTVMVDGVPAAGTISGNTIWIDNVTLGPHLFEHQP